MPSQKGWDRRHITAWHTIRRGFQALLNQNNLDFEGLLASQLDGLAGQADEFKDVAVKDLLNPASDVYAKLHQDPANTAVLSFIEGLNILRKNEDKKNGVKPDSNAPPVTVGDLLESYRTLQNADGGKDQEKARQTNVELGLYVAFNNPQNLWGGPKGDNRILPGLKTSVDTLMNKFEGELNAILENPALTDAEKLEKMGDVQKRYISEAEKKRDAATADVAKGAWDLVVTILNNANKRLVERTDGKFEQVPAEPTPTEFIQNFQAAASEVDAVVRDNVDTDANLPHPQAPWSRWETTSTLQHALSESTSEPEREALRAAISALDDGDVEFRQAFENARAALAAHPELQALVPDPSDRNFAESERTRDYHRNWRPSAEAANALLDAASGKQVDPAAAQKVVNGFVNSDPLRNTPKELSVEGSQADEADAQKIHELLLENSETYRDAYLGAVWNAPHGTDGEGNPSGSQDLKIKFVPPDDPTMSNGQRRSASYDPSSHTILLRTSDVPRDQAALDKLATNLAFEMFNASRGNAYRTVENRVQTGPRDNEALLTERFVNEIIDLEKRSVADYEQFRGEVMGSLGDLPLDRPSNAPSGDPSTTKPSNEAFYAAQIREWLNDPSTPFDLRVWKPRAGTLAPNAPTGSSTPAEDPRPTKELSNSEIAIAVNPDDGEVFLHYWVADDRLYGSNQPGADIMNPDHRWTDLGKAPVGLPTEQGIHVNKEHLRLHYDVDGQWKSAGEKPDNFDSALAVNPEDGEFFLHYWVDEDRQLHGSNDQGADIDNPGHSWTALGSAPDELPTGELLHVNKDGDSKKLHHNVEGEGWVPQGEGSLWFGGLKDAFGKGPASWLQGAPPFSEDNSVDNLFTFSGPGGITVSASQQAGYTVTEDRTSVSAQIEVKVTLADGTDVIGNLDVTVDASGHAVTTIGFDHGLDEDGNGVIGAEAIAQAAAVITAGFQNEAVRIGVSAGVGAGANGRAKIVFRDGVPLGFAAGGGFEAGASFGGDVTVGNDDVSVTAGGGAIFGFAAGGDVAIGLQEDGKVHLEFEAKLAFLGGFRVHFDLAVDPDAVLGWLRDFVENTKTGQEAQEFWEAFEDSTVGSAVITAGEAILDQAVDAFNRQVDRLKTAAEGIKNAGEAIADSAVVGQIIADAKASVDAVKTAVEKVVGSDAAQAFAAAAKTQIDWVADKLEDSEAVQAFVNGMKEAWDIVDGPLKKMGKRLGALAQRQLDTYKAAFEGIGDAFKALGESKAFKVFKHHAKEAGRAVGEFADDVGAGIVSTATTAINWSDKAIREVVDFGKKVGDFAEDVGGAIVGGLKKANPKRWF